MTHLKEKLQFVQAENQVQKARLREVEDLAAKVRKLVCSQNVIQQCNCFSLLESRNHIAFSQLIKGDWFCNLGKSVTTQFISQNWMLCFFAAICRSVTFCPAPNRPGMLSASTTSACGRTVACWEMNLCSETLRSARMRVMNLNKNWRNSKCSMQSSRST